MTEDIKQKQTKLSEHEMSGFGDFGQELNEEELFEQADP